MRLTALLSGREAMMSEGAALASVSDNISNMNTTGFKSGRAEFANLLADSEGSLYSMDVANPGNGSKVQNLQVRHDKQGSFDFTGRSLDSAVDGNGFFVLSDGTSQSYTRAGNFKVDKTGNLVSEDDLSVMGFTAASPTALVSLSASAVTGAATASTTSSIAGNLNTGSLPFNGTGAAAPDPTSFKTLSDAADFVTPISVVDSLGAVHDVSLYFFNTGALGYTVQAYVDSAEVTPDAPGTPVAAGTGTVTFQPDGTQGGAATTMTITGPAWANGANASSVALDLSELTGYASQSALSKVTIDGNRAGSPIGYEVLNDGSFNVTLDTGDSITVGTLALATFPSVQGLEKMGNNRFREGDEAGTPVIGAPLTVGKGELVGGALESSNVDPASEFVDLVRYQRAYQAGSQIVTTMSELLGTTIQLA